MSTSIPLSSPFPIDCYIVKQNDWIQGMISRYTLVEQTKKWKNERKMLHKIAAGSKGRKDWANPSIFRATLLILHDDTSFFMKITDWGACEPLFVCLWANDLQHSGGENCGEYPLFDKVWPPFEKSWLSPCKLYIVYGITFLFDTLLLSLKVGTVTDTIFISGVPSSPDGRKTQFCGNLLSPRHFKNLKIDWTTDQT